MIDDRLPVRTAHPTWWRAPLIATLPGAPLLVWEYSLFRADGYTSGIETVIVLGMILLAVSWLLPHRRSSRGLRLFLAGTALTTAVLPLLFAVALGAAMST
ncbi:hypothetical protein [Streptomyces sp. NPDC093094]|uniref:hypothetical protein n=1 Tax=Streptomyces sp. NPDC093094 TaxID=3366026 RepID=UPI0037FBC62A